MGRSQRSRELKVLQDVCVTNACVEEPGSKAPDVCNLRAPTLAAEILPGGSEISCNNPDKLLFIAQFLGRYYVVKVDILPLRKKKRQQLAVSECGAKNFCKLQ